MRQVLSTALVALIVGALAGAGVGALAQSPEEAAGSAISPAAVSDINAHRVDGKHAVGAGASKANRAGKLVATNASGMLPANIVKPNWGNLQNVPAGFADGVDNAGVTGVTVTTVTHTGIIPAHVQNGVAADCPAGSVVVGGGARGLWFPGAESISSEPDGSDRWVVTAFNNTNFDRDVTAFARCLSTTPAAAVSSTGLKAPAKRRR